MFHPGELIYLYPLGHPSINEMYTSEINKEIGGLSCWCWWLDGENSHLTSTVKNKLLLYSCVKVIALPLFDITMVLEKNGYVSSLT
jgi:hypothetical protein